MDKERQQFNRSEEDKRPSAGLFLRLIFGISLTTVFFFITDPDHLFDNETNIKTLVEGATQQVQPEKTTTSCNCIDSDLSDPIAPMLIQKLHNGRAVIGTVEGNCAPYPPDFDEFIRCFKDCEHSNSFIGIPSAMCNSQEKDFYFDLMYLKAIETGYCPHKEKRYKAQLGITEAQCRPVRVIELFGTDDFSRYMFDQIIQRLNELGLHNIPIYENAFEVDDCCCESY